MRCCNTVTNQIYVYQSYSRTFLHFMRKILSLGLSDTKVLKMYPNAKCSHFA